MTRPFVAALSMAALVMSACGDTSGSPTSSPRIPSATPVTRPCLPVSTAGAARYLKHETKVGQGLFRLDIPTLHVDILVVEGVTSRALQTGAGHYPQTPLPGQRGNVGVAGQRRFYGRPFAHLDRLQPGDKIRITTPTQTLSYAVVPGFDGHGNPWVLPADE